MRADRKSQVAGRRWQAWLLALLLAVQVVGPVGVAAAGSAPAHDSCPAPATAAPEAECEDNHCT